MSDGGTQIVLQLPQKNIASPYHLLAKCYDCDLELTIIVNQDLKLDLKTLNRGQSTISISQALHSYFNISDIRDIFLSGLEQSVYIDKLHEGQSGTQMSVLKFSAETDSVYLDTQNEIILSDPGFGRTILVSKKNSLSTIVWNPWQEKATQMDDMGDNAWQNMVCIEPANVLHNQSSLSGSEYLTVSCLIQAQDIYP